MIRTKKRNEMLYYSFIALILYSNLYTHNMFISSSEIQYIINYEYPLYFRMNYKLRVMQNVFTNQNQEINVDDVIRLGFLKLLVYCNIWEWLLTF